VKAAGRRRARLPGQEVAVPRSNLGVPDVPLTCSPHSEQQAWNELWEACVVVLDRYPHIRPPASPANRVLRHVRIPQAAVDASDVHFHLD
jgi:hypothetical protein